jgi:hypothetical protein
MTKGNSVPSGKAESPQHHPTKTGRHDIAEELLKVALNTKINIRLKAVKN